MISYMILTALKYRWTRQTSRRLTSTRGCYEYPPKRAYPASWRIASQASDAGRPRLCGCPRPLRASQAPAN